MAQNLLDKISSISNELSKSERRVATAILEDPHKVVSENIAQLAARVGVSQPTVFRFCKHFGAEGFPDFKLALNASLSFEGNIKAREIRNGDSVEDVVSKIVEGTMAAIKDLERNLDVNVLARSIDVLSQARRIVTLAQGLSLSQAQDFKAHLLNVGLCTEVYSDPALMLPASVSLHPGEVIVAISATGHNADVISACTKAQDSGCSIITICPNNSPLSKLSNLQLNAGKTKGLDKDQLELSRTGIQCLLQILVSGLTLRRADLIGRLRPKINAALSAVYNQEPQMPAIDDSQFQTNTLQPNEPITTIKWPNAY